MTNAVLAIGTEVQVQDPVSLVWTSISEPRSIAGPDLSVDEKDVTNHQSPNRTRERLATLKDPGMLSFEINFIPSDPTHDDLTGLLYQYLNFGRPNIRVVLPDTGHKTMTAPAFVKSFKLQEKVDDVLIAAVEMRFISGQTFSGT